MIRVSATVGSGSDATADGLRFALEIVPLHIADRGLSATLPKARWERIRQRVSEEHGHRCAACGISRWGARLQCHEVWNYDLATVRPPTPEEVEARSARGKRKKTRWDLVGDKARNSVRRGVRRLVGFMPLCGPCHRAKHSDWPCLMFAWTRRDLAAEGRDPEPGEVLQLMLTRDREGYRFGFGLRARTRFAELNHGVPLAVLEAHCLEACAMREARKGIEWASDYGGFDRLDESS